jgi:hypothetical protein
MNLIMPIIVYLSLWIDIASEIVFALVLTCLNWLGKFALAIIFLFLRNMRIQAILEEGAVAQTNCS